MKITNKAWYTLYEPDFDTNEFLYHYTSIGSAVKILENDSLKFSAINNTNDPLEAKPKIQENDSKIEDSFTRAIKIFKEMNSVDIQLLCFARDMDKHLSTENERTRFSDYSGRGFAYPRMWAQYAHNNEGVCFVFEKTKLMDLIENSLGPTLIASGNVEYVSQFQSFDLSKETIDSFLKYIDDFKTDKLKGIVCATFLMNNDDFVRYNYFHKLDDWAGEHEFRFLAFGDNEHYIQRISDALVGVIVGEKINTTDERIIKMFCENKFELKKISFAYSGSKLTNLN